jgi:uncharacterized protein YkwD
MRWPIVFLLIILLGLAGWSSREVFLPSTRAVIPVKTEIITYIDEDYLREINEWRVSKDFPAYKNSEFLCGIADIRVVEVQTNFSHEGFDADRFNAGGKMGENLIEGAYTPKDALDRWLNSLLHRINLESNYTHSCIRCQNGYCAHILGYY